MSARLNDLAARAARTFRIPTGSPPSPGPWFITNSAGEIALVVTGIRVTPTSDDDCTTGLLGFIELELGWMFRIDGITLRLTEAGSLSLSFPSRGSRGGTRHALVRPTDAAARAAIERTIFDALGIRQEARS